ncbi:chromosome segregation protein SMC [Staphylococcus massiliensis]|uniref:chromosome segregation protein SMC n=1 Tax=Staphylococcus massiliensis TaxID=555791 RepID=UPI00370DD12E
MVYLKSIDTYGFKSFAEHTHVQFDTGVTAIVGPNGSGKSNITDAIKWVLGEQSAKSLRGSKMEDIIFSGAEHRKGNQYAEVKLQLDNHSGTLNLDQDIVTVTRRLYRNGDSAYYLNNDRARLKDIVELFLDSGLGKEAFSIISQGRVDEILNAKPIDRRQILEESAGVLKYKKRKKASLDKLEQTEDNLNRVEDILYDLEGRIEPLKEEAAIAKEYLVLSQEMMKSDILVTVHDIEAYQDDINQQDESLNRLKSQQEFKNSEKTRIQREIKSIKSQKDQADLELEKLNYQFVQKTEEVEKYTGQLHVLEERKRNQSETNARFEEELESLQTQLAQLQSDRDTLKQDIDSLKSKSKQLTQHIHDMESEVMVSDDEYETQLETLKNDYYEEISKQSELNNDIRFLKRTIEENEKKQSRLDSKLVEAIESLKGIQTEKASKERAFQEVAQSLEQYEREQQDNENALKQKKSRLGELEEKLYQAYRYNQKLKSKIDGMEMRKDDYAYFFSGVKHILKNKDLSGIHGAVAEVIDVPSKLTKAIETALGAQLQHVIVDNEEDGRNAISYLKSKGLGRATLLPLNVIKPRYLNETIYQQAKHEDGFIGVAANEIHFNKQYETIVQNLLGTTIIVDHLKHANDIARQTGYKSRIVTLDGDIVNPGGSMTGGGERHNKSILSQKDELQTIKNQLHEYESKTKLLEEQCNAEKLEQERLSESYVTCSEKIQHLRHEYQSLEMAIKHLDEQERRIKDDHEEFEFEKNDGYEIGHSQKTLAEKESELQTLQQKLQGLEAEIEQVRNRFKSDKADTHEKQQKLNQMKSDLAVVKERLKTKKEQYENVNHQLENNQQQNRRLQEQIELFNSDEMTGEKAFQKIEAQIEASQHEKDDLDKAIEASKQSRKELAESLESLEGKLQVEQNDILAIENSYQDIKTKQSRLDVLIQHAIEHLQETYATTYEHARTMYELDDDIEALRKKVKLTKMSIDELGPVNLNAIEQFEEINERFTFLDSQRTDLREAKQTLDQIIQEMDQEVKTRFKDTFLQVKAHFSDVFKSLFGGGSAELKLTDDDYLSAGVDIIVQPPGKKLQHLSLLSGGERALSAIALLFAILKVRSAPFVILDEVEAALDEANVIRYATYLKQLANDTQFIVITHRKGTMEYADRLYGVTMQESGVSKLVSVNLNTIDDVMKEEA